MVQEIVDQSWQAEARSEETKQFIKEGKAYFQVGGGIIYDSEPEAEYVETLDKARALIQALQLAPEVVVATK